MIHVTVALHRTPLAERGPEPHTWPASHGRPIIDCALVKHGVKGHYTPQLGALDPPAQFDPWPARSPVR